MKGRNLFAVVLAVALATLLVGAVDIPDPVIWWDMESVSNGKLADRCGNGHDLTLGAGAPLTVEVTAVGSSPSIEGT